MTLLVIPLINSVDHRVNIYIEEKAPTDTVFHCHDLHRILVSHKYIYIYLLYGVDD